MKNKSIYDNIKELKKPIKMKKSLRTEKKDEKCQ